MANDNNDSAIYTMAEVRKMLGISKDSVYKLARANAFPVFKLGKKYISPKAAFDEWLRNPHLSTNEYISRNIDSGIYDSQNKPVEIIWRQTI